LSTGHVAFGSVHIGAMKTGNSSPEVTPAGQSGGGSGVKRRKKGRAAGDFFIGLNHNIKQAVLLKSKIL
jgi:hypothetical protein